MRAQKILFFVISILVSFTKTFSNDPSENINFYLKDRDLNSAVKVLLDTFEYTADITKGKKLSVELKSHADKLGDKKNLGIAYQMIGRECWLLGEYDSAFYNYSKAIEILKNTDAEIEKFDNYIYVGLLYKTLKDFEQAKNNFLEAGNYLSGIKELRFFYHRTAVYYWNLGHIETKLGNYSKSEKYLQKADSLVNLIDWLPHHWLDVGKSLVNYYLADMYVQSGNSQKALQKFNYVNELMKNHPVPFIYINSTALMGVPFNKLSLYDSTIKYCNLALKLSNGQNIDADAEACKNLSFAYENKHNLIVSLEYYKKYKELADKININDRNVSDYIKTKNIIEKESEKNKAERLFYFQIFLGFIIILILALTYFIYNKYKLSANINFELEKINQTKDKLFSIISHDLRGPLSSFAQISEMMSKNIEKFDKENISKNLTVLSKSSRSIYNLLESLLSWSKNQLKVQEPDFKQMNLKDCIDKTINDLQILAIDKNISFSKTIRDDMFVYADSDMFCTVLRNIVSNAIKYSQKDSQIYINTFTQKDECIVEVIDNGIGIPDELCDKIFKVDYSNRRSGTNMEKGAGLGLNLSKDLIEKMNGEIGFENLNSGTKFYVKLRTN